MSFAFSFSGDDIQEDEPTGSAAVSSTNIASDDGRETVVAGGRSDGGNDAAQSAAPPPSAFPVQGRPQLPPVHHDLPGMLARLPSKIAYGTIDVDLDGRGSIRLPRRELWDVRVQLMAEDEEQQGGGEDSELTAGLGKHDVKTGIYEGGFKSWESSVDLVKVLAAESLSPVAALKERPVRVIELGCGTALPSLALFQWASAMPPSQRNFPLSITVADYNPTVLYLVTLPNFLLAWALQHQDENAVVQQALTLEGELELTAELKAAFQQFLLSAGVSLSFVSGGWSPAFVDLLYSPGVLPQTFEAPSTVVLGAETIYSPFALEAFTETLLAILNREQDGRPNNSSVAIVAAKRLYFGVGGSLDDFVAKIKAAGVVVNGLREEAEGVRRGVVQCLLA